MKNMIVHRIHTRHSPVECSSHSTHDTRRSLALARNIPYPVPRLPTVVHTTHSLNGSAPRVYITIHPMNQGIKRETYGAATGSRHVRRGNKKPRAIGHLRGFPFCRRPALQWEALRWSVGEQTRFELRFHSILHFMKTLCKVCAPRIQGDSPVKIEQCHALN